MTTKIDSTVRALNRAKKKLPLWELLNWGAVQGTHEQDAQGTYIAYCSYHLPYEQGGKERPLRLPEMKGGADSHLLDLLGEASFRDYLWHLSQHGMIPIRSPKKLLNGTPSRIGEYWRIADIAAVMFDFQKIDIFAAARGLDASQLLHSWADYLYWDKSHGVFAEYREFIDMWGAKRVPANVRGNLFLEVIYNYVRERVEAPTNFA
jgi:hypothetical protein